MAEAAARRRAPRLGAAVGTGGEPAHRLRPERGQPVARYHGRPRRARLDRSPVPSHAGRWGDHRGRPLRRSPPLVRLGRLRDPGRGRARAANGSCGHRSLRRTRHADPRSLRCNRPQLPRQRRPPRLRTDHRSAPRGGWCGRVVYPLRPPVAGLAGRAPTRTADRRRRRDRKDRAVSGRTATGPLIFISSS